MSKFSQKSMKIVMVKVVQKILKIVGNVKMIEIIMKKSSKIL